VLNTPPRGLGAKTIETLLALAEQHHLSPASILNDLSGSGSVFRQAFGTRPASALAEFGQRLAAWHSLTASAPVATVLESVLRDVRYREFIHDGTEEGEDRWANVEEFLALAQEDPDLSLEIFLENVATLAAVPFWLRVSDRIGKHRAVALAALWLAVFSLPLPLLGAGQGAWLVALVVVRGSSFASILFLANSIAADVVDHDVIASGQQRTGLFFAVWGMVIKLAVALGVLLGTTLPAAFGFEPSMVGEGAADGSALLALRVVYGWLPAALMALGAPFLWHFPITRATQEALRAEIAARGTGA